MFSLQRLTSKGLLSAVNEISLWLRVSRKDRHDIRMPDAWILGPGAGGSSSAGTGFI